MTTRPKLPESVLQHSARTSLLDRTAHWSLDGPVLNVDDGKTSTRVSVSAIRDLRLISFAGVGGRQWRVSVRTDDGRRFTLSSHHYAGVSSFENRIASFTPLVRALATAVAAANPAARFIAGSLGLWLAWLVVCVLLVVLALAIVSVVLAPDPGWLSVASSTALLVSLCGLSLRWLARSYPKRIDAAAMSDTLPR